MRRYLILILAGLLTGCGFHLRGEEYCHLPIQQIHIASPSPYGPLESQLRIAFARASVSVNENECSPYTLVIKGVSLHHNTPSIGTSSQTRVYTFYYDVDFDLLGARHHPLLMSQHIRVTHHIAVPAGQLLSTNNQVSILERYMIHDAIVQLFHRLNTTNIRQQLLAPQVAQAELVRKVLG